MSCRSRNDFDTLYILIEIEGRVQYNQPLRLGDCHRGIGLRTVCGELRMHHNSGGCTNDDDNRCLAKGTGKDLMHETTQMRIESRLIANELEDRKEVSVECHE